MIKIYLCLVAAALIALTGTPVSGQETVSLNGRNCELCKMFVSEMFKFVKENRTEERIREGLSYICKIVPKEQEEQCQSLVYSYTKEIIEIMIDETNPGMVCTLLEQCHYQTAPKVKQAEPISLGDFINLLEPDHPDKNVFACVECKLFIKYLQNEFNDSISQEQLKEWLLTNLCGKLDDENLKKSCIQLVEDKSAFFFRAVADQLDPRETCMELQACPKRLYNLVFNNAPNKPLLPDLTSVEQVLRPIILEPKPRNPACDICVDVVSRFDDYLSTNEIDHDMDVLVKQVCEKIPLEPYKKSCIHLVKTFGQEIISLIELMDNPRDLCTKISLCSP